MTASVDSTLRATLARLVTTKPSVERSEATEWLKQMTPLAPGAAVQRVVDGFTGESSALGIVDSLFDDEQVTEVMVNGAGPVWIDRGSGPRPTELDVTEADVWLMIDRILDPLGLRVDRSKPFADARLPDGSRVHVIVPPLAIDGPAITIRRFNSVPLPLERFGPPDAVTVLSEIVRARQTVVVVGPTAAGKTSLLNAIGRLLDGNERLITIEDTAELALPGPHVVRLEARPPNSEGVGEVTLRQLVRNALRMRPDRLIIGEVRGPEALDLVLALNTGHRGSLATCHGSDPIGALHRITTLALMADTSISDQAIRDQVWRGIDVIVCVDRVGGRRQIVEIARIPDAAGDLIVPAGPLEGRRQR